MMLNNDIDVDTIIVIHVIYSYRIKSVTLCMMLVSAGHPFDEKVDALQYLIDVAQAYQSNDMHLPGLLYWGEDMLYMLLTMNRDHAISLPTRD
jgi:hypothetical protein